MWAALCGAKGSAVIMHFLSMNLVFNSKALLGGGVCVCVCVHVYVCARVCVTGNTPQLSLRFTRVAAHSKSATVELSRFIHPAPSRGLKQLPRLRQMSA